MSDALDKNGLKCMNAALPENYEAKLVPDEGRIYYVDHKTQQSSWLPPRENWDPGTQGLPYGWEAAVDKNKKPYFVNHVENFNTRDDPRDDPDYVEPPKAREVELERDPQKGFGFVAGSEKPVVVRFVTEGGPSVEKLQPGDQIIKINGQDVKKAPREFVIDLVRSCKQTINLTVCQPYNDNKTGWMHMIRDVMGDLPDVTQPESTRKSALLTAAKKDRLKKNPSRVRFAEEIIVNGAAVSAHSPEENYMQFMPNVLKVFLDNGQTKSFKYDQKTTVKDVVNSLQEKLNLKDIHHFNLVLHNMKSHMPGRMMLLQEHELISEIAGRPGARHFRCLFRVMYVPRDSYDLLKQDPIAFEYFYMQCVNDVLQDRFANELKQETLLRLSALHIQQHAMSNNYTGKINIKTVEKEFGLEKFVPASIREAFKVKDLRKVLAQCLKMNQNLTAPGQKHLTALQAKLHYMKIVSELKTFGSRVFMVTLLDKKTEAMVIVGPKAGVSLVTNVRFYTLSMLADFNEIQSIKVTREKDNMNRVELTVKGEEPGTLNLGLLKDDATNFVSMVNGYYRIFVDTNANLILKNAGRQSDDPEIPVYESKHLVLPAPWSYPEDIVSMVIEEEEGEGERVVDLSRPPPAYDGSSDNRNFIEKLKYDLGIKAEESVTSDGASSNSVPVKVRFPAAKDNNENHIETQSPPTTSPAHKVPVKTVIKIESPRQEPATKQTESPPSGSDKRDSDSMSSASSLSQNSSSEHEISPKPPKRRYRSPTPDARKRPNSLPIEDYDEEEGPEYMNSPTKIARESRSSSRKSDQVEYMNVRQTRKKTEANSSDTDSGVGGDSDSKPSYTLPKRPAKTVDGVSGEMIDSSGRSNGSHDADRTGEMEGELDSWDLPPEDTDKHEIHLLHGVGCTGDDDLPLDLSSLLDPAYMSGSPGRGQESPSSSASLDADASFMGPFDADQLPPEIGDAVYDARMFASKDLYFDPDIIDLTLLPPFPPTEDEMRQNSGGQMDNGHPHTIHRMTTVSGDPQEQQHHHQRVALQKSASVGYTPDFLDNDIDAIIEQLTVQPPPSGNERSLPPINDDGLDHSWNGPSRQNGGDGMEFENREMSKTIDLGSLGIDDEYNSLVIPPPPMASEDINDNDLMIVPPVESVKDKRKMFEKTDSVGYLKKFGKKEVVVSASENNDEKDKSDNVPKSESKEEMNDSKSGLRRTDSQNESSPASVSEKLNALLKSLSTYDAEDEAVGTFRRTSSLRLGRCASLDFINTPNGQPDNGKKNDLVVGSVRVRPTKVRPKLNIERPGSGHIVAPIYTNSLERLSSNGSTSSEQDRTVETITFTPGFQRTQSVDVLAEEPEKTNDDDKSGEVDSSMSESFASLKAKLQSYRDSLLNRSLRRKKKLEEGKDGSDKDADRLSLDGDVQRRSSLTRSNSFSSLIRRSLGRTSGKDVKNKMEGRSSSETRADNNSTDGSKEDLKTGSKDRKYWNTLTTPRSNFRPNTSSAQSQEYFKERLSPKPPLPTSAHTPPGGAKQGQKGEGRKHKAGPMKALSSVFDKPASEDNLSIPASSHKREKSPKRMAPSTPGLSSQSEISSVVTSTIPSSNSGQSNSSNSFTSNVMSSVFASSGSLKPQTKPIILSKPLSIPTAPPRRKHGQATEERSKSPLGEKLSKDDSELNKASPTKSNIKASPFSTVGKMWRPMSMTTSASSDQEETYQTFNNFDILRDMTGEKLPLSANPRDQVPDPILNGHAGRKKEAQRSAGSKSMTKRDNKFGSLSEKSFALLKEKVNASHSNIVKQVLDSVYTSEDFGQATSDVDRLLNELKQTMESLKSSRIDRKPVQFDMCKEELQTQVRQFVTDAKLLVSNATQTKAKLALNMDSSMHSLAKIFLHGQATMFMMEAIHQAQHLGSEVMRVANAYKSTLNAAHAAVGKPLSDPHMKYLMRQATNLASLLSTLLKSLKSLRQS